jgi:MFS-type transporter involved in bile tolerance (Atg22 family)
MLCASLRLIHTVDDCPMHFIIFSIIHLCYRAWCVRCQQPILGQQTLIALLGMQQSSIWFLRAAQERIFNAALVIFLLDLCLEGARRKRNSSLYLGFKVVLVICLLDSRLEAAMRKSFFKQQSASAAKIEEK